MIRAILIDDEPDAIESLRLDINEYCSEIQIIGEAVSPKEGMQLIRSKSPDLVFLDVEMPWMNGFEMLDLLRPINFEVIFVTAYDSYAVEAFKVSAVDYLMKPVDKNDLINAVEKVKEKMQKSLMSNDKIQDLLESYFSKSKINKIAIPDKEGQKFIRPEEILYVEAESNYSIIHLKDGKQIVVTSTLKSLEQKLDKNTFARVHNSFLVNLAEVEQHVRKDGGHLLLSNNAQIPISRSKKSELKELFENKYN